MPFFKLSFFRTLMAIFGLWAFIYVAGPLIRLKTDELFVWLGGTVGL